ncbi:MAG TPA: hypothetical protein VFC63_08215, partial [Blastocatellia bacterium]|nr:hypothetical protein [Blastocatellia bacterium]
MRRNTANRAQISGQKFGGSTRFAFRFKAGRLVILLIFLAVPAISKTKRINYSIEDPGGRAMRNFYASLLRTATSSNDGNRPAITRIIHYGDSHIAADILTGALRQDFKTDFGNAGPGFILAGRPWSYYAPGGVRSGTSPGWHITGLRQSDLIADGKYGLAGISFTAEKAGESVNLTADCQSFDIYFLSQPQGGDIEVRLDGFVSIPRFSLDSANYKAT